MAKKIAVLIGSPRAKGNTSCLAEAFCQGAIEAGKQVDVIRVCDYNIAPCVGCNYCFINNKHECAQTDDMAEIYSRLTQADVIVIATPVYFFGMSAQLKCVIDRLHNPVRDDFKVKKLALLAVGASHKDFVFDTLRANFESVLKHFSLENGGVVTVNGMKDEGDISGHPALVLANNLGKNI